jgi:dolichyl-phosphate beta-glucosyltransferase
VVDGEDGEAYRKALADVAVIVVGYDKNKGKGYAIRQGFKVSRAPLIIYTDADIPFSESSMLRMVETLKANAGKSICVIGDRTLPGSVYFDDISRVRKAGSDCFLKIIKVTLGKEFADTQCGLKGFTRNAAQLIFPRSVVNRFAFDFECLYIAKQLNLEVIKIPVLLRNQSHSTVNVIRDGWKLMQDVLKVIAVNKYDREHTF